MTIAYNTYHDRLVGVFHPINQGCIVQQVVSMPPSPPHHLLGNSLEIGW